MTLLFLLTLALAQSEAPMMIDRVVAIVGEKVLTSSDIRIQTELNQRIPSPVRALQDTQRRDPTLSLIEQSIIYEIAAQVDIYQPTPEEVLQRLNTLKETFSSPEEYDRFREGHGVNTPELMNTILIRLTVEQYIHRNIDLSSQSAREDEAAYLKRYRDWIESQMMSSAIRMVEQQP